MFNSLQEGLQSAFKSLRGKGKLSEANMREALQMVQQSLLESDVNYEVIQDFMGRVTEKAVGERVLKSLDPSQQVVEIVHRELIELLGPEDHSLHLTKDVTVIMLCGLQGAGKTTTCGKLAQLLLENNITPTLVALDLKRPAAIEQLHVLGEQLNVPVYSELGAENPVTVARNGVAKAKQEQSKVVILDTAGRLAIDQELMDELTKIDNQVQPDQVYLVVDGMTGQDAVNSAGAFNEALELNGVIMTKLDGDARGGALLSVRAVTGVPVKFIGTGEHMDALEPFRAEGMADRILNMGDVVELARRARQLVTEEEQREMEEKMSKGTLTLDDFRDQMLKLSKPGLMTSMLQLIPGLGGQLKDLMGNQDMLGNIKQTVGIIDSMTPAEKKNPDIIDPSRRNRIAKGSGTQVQDVNGLIKQFEQMKPMMQMMSGQGMKGRMEMMQQLQREMMDPAGRGPRLKKGTGKRLTKKEKEKMKKQREKEKRRRKRESKS